MRAALYARVSTNEQRQESIADQLRECHELCRRHEFQIVKEFSDYARSGNEANRPAYQRLLKAARHGEFGVVVAHELSRLWRSESEMHAIKEEFEYLDIHVVTDDGIDTRIVGMDILIVKGAMAKQELRQIAHRTHRALKGLALEGRSAGGKCYGYRSATLTTSGQREIDAAQAREVRRIFSWYAEGKSPRWIADRLNEEGVPSDPGAATDAEQASQCDEDLIHQRRLRHLRDQVSNLVDAIAHGALRSSAVIANRLLELEARLAEEEARAPRGDQPPQHGVTQSVQFYEQFFATISEQFRESACETRSALGKLVGGAVRLMPKEEAQELEVTCALGTTTLSLNELIRA